MTTDKHIAALHKALTAIPEEDRDYAARFVRANAGKDLDALLEHWNRDQADREQAAEIERHRRERVLSEFRDTFGAEAIAEIAGVSADAVADESKGS